MLVPETFGDINPFWDNVITDLSLELQDLSHQQYESFISKFVTHPPSNPCEHGFFFIFWQKTYIASWWFQPIWKIRISQFGSFPPRIGVKLQKMLWNPPDATHGSCSNDSEKIPGFSSNKNPHCTDLPPPDFGHLFTHLGLPKFLHLLRWHGMRR